MGLINFFKKLFSKKVIQMPTKKQDIVIQPQSSGYTTVEIGQKILVEEGWNAVIVAKDTVLDVFGEGTHEISLAYIPKTTKALGLDKGKVQKNGQTAEIVLPSKFKCDLYFVKTSYIEKRKWQSGMIKVREKGKKKFSYSAVGTYSFQVQEPAKFVGLFLIEWAKIKPGKAIKKFDAMVSELITDILWFKKFKSTKALSEYEFGNLTLKPLVFKNFKKYGVAVTDVNVENIIYPQNLKLEELESVQGEVVKDEEKESEAKNDIKELNENLSSENFQNAKEKELTTEEFAQEKKIPFQNFEQSEIKCQSCGAINPNGSKFCNQCGKLIKGE